ncbi:MAG: ATP-binding protein [Deltaproteobacteria bacterium]|nr:ATP-binding protein [Deltaproteobacteria bacterium]
MSPGRLEALLREHPEQAYQQALQIVQSESCSLQRVSNFLLHPFTNLTESASERLAFVSQVLQSLRANHQELLANQLQSQLESAQGFEELLSTVGQGTFIFARNHQERIGFVIGLGSHVAGSLAYYLSTRVGLGGAASGLASGIVNALFQSGMNVLVQEYLFDQHQGRRERAAELGQSVMDALLCSAAAMAFEHGEQNGFGQGSLLWSALKFSVDVGVEFCSGKLGLVKYVAGVEREAWGHVGWGMLANAAGEGLGDAGNHYITSHVTHRIDAATQRYQERAALLESERAEYPLNIQTGLRAGGGSGTGKITPNNPPVHPPTRLPRQKLQLFVAAMITATRADAIPGREVHLQNRMEHILSQEGFTGLLCDLESRQLPLESIDLLKKIFQTDDANRGAVEAICNGFDADSKKVTVKAQDGEMKIEDEGRGMSLYEMCTSLLIPGFSKNKLNTFIGRFGVGFYTLLQYLRTEEDHVRVTSTQDGKTHELLLTLKEGEYHVSLQKLKPKKKNGTQICVKSNAVQEQAIQTEIRQYLRYFRKSLDLIYNREKINNCVMELVFGPLSPTLPLQGGGSSQSPLPLGERVRVRGQTYTVFQNPQGTPGKVVIMAGDVVVEEFTSPVIPAQIGISTPELGTETILQLPLSTKMDQPRRGVGASPELYAFIKNFTQSPHCNIQLLNALVPLAIEMDTRSPQLSYLELLRTRMQALFLENSKLKFYSRSSTYNESDLILFASDSSSLPRGERPTEGRERVISDDTLTHFLHPALWVELYANRLRKPKGVVYA